MADNKNKPTEAQLVYERIEELKAEGTSFADAVRTVAEERGKKPNAVRANYYNHQKRLDGGAPAPRRRGRSARSEALTPERAVAQAKALLEQALSAIDSEVDAAKSEADAAQARYEELSASVAERKAELERKLEALA